MPDQRVTFYVLPDVDEMARLNLACRLAEKAYLGGQRVVVRCGSVDEARALDERLWVFSEKSFVPHELVERADDDTPVCIAAGDSFPDAALLLNLAASQAPGWQRFERILEVVDGDPERRQQARERFRSYREAGVAPQTHNLESGA